MSSDSTASIAPGQAGYYDLQKAGDFIERVKALGATAVVVGNISVRFPDVLGPQRKQMPMTEEQRLAIQEHSA